MIEFDFLAFCITIVALAAIARDKDEIARDAISILKEMNRQIISLVSKLSIKRRP